MVEVVEKKAEEIGFLTVEEESSMGGDDFSFYEENIRGCYIKIGTGIGHPIHHPGFCVNPEVLYKAAEFLAGVIGND